MEAPAPNEPRKGIIGRSIAVRRFEIGESQRDLAARLAGIPHQQIAAWERGIEPNVRNLRRIALALGKPIDWFLEEHPDLEADYRAHLIAEALRKFGDDADTVFPARRP